MKSLLVFPALLSLSRYSSTSLHFANAALVNQTIDDSDLVFSYSPSANWQGSNNASCSTCLQPNFRSAFQGTLHYAIHASGPDADDIGKSSSQSPSASEAPVPPDSTPSQPTSPPSSSSLLLPTSPSLSSSGPSVSPSSLPSSSSPLPSLPSKVPAVEAASQTTTQALAVPSSIPPLIASSTGDNSGKKKGGGSDGGGGGGLSRREMVNLRRTDADDPNFVDVNVTATMSFTGSAFYVFCALPVQINNASTLALTNLTFFLDGQLVGNYTHNPRTDTDSPTGFRYQVMVFSKVNLLHVPHVLVIKPALGSMALLDYVRYTTFDIPSSGNANGSMVPQPTPTGSVHSASNGSSKENTTTFAVAIGSTMGVLAVLSFTVFVSIYMRRRKSAKRQKLLEVLEAVNRPPSPEMRGPQPFIPRYFGNIPPHASSLPPFSLFPIASSSSEETGPSHGLDFPPAPEHSEAPAYSPPPLVLSQAISIPISLLPPVTHMPPQREVELPQYHDVEHTPLVTLPMFTSTRSQGVMEPSPSSSWRTEGGVTHSSSSLLPGRSDINQECVTGRTNISTPNNSDEHPD